MTDPTHAQRMSDGVIPQGIADDAALIETVLSPQVHQLLHTIDSAVFAERLLRLNLDAARPDDAEELDQAVHTLLARHATLRERIARLLVALAVVLIVLTAAALLASFTLATFHRYIGVSWLDWPPHPALLVGVTISLLTAWAAGMLATQIRAQERVRLARLACGVAAEHGLASWPGIAIDSPFRSLARRWQYFGWTVIVLALGVVALAGALDAVGFVVVFVALIWGVVGAGLLWYARPWVRADVLAQRTLFVGAPQ